MKNSKHECTAVMPKQYPQTNFPEIALLGRSNVGKSSFINSILNRRNLARVGATPGKTRVINFYNVENAFYIVDLPGYGYAKASKTAKDEWKKIVETYLFDREQIKMLAMIVDIRHKPTENDEIMFNWVKMQEIPFMIIANKQDKIPKSKLKMQVDVITKTFKINEDIIVLPFSSKTKYGLDKVWEVIDEKLEKDK